MSGGGAGGSPPRAVLSMRHDAQFDAGLVVQREAVDQIGAGAVIANHRHLGPALAQAGEKRGRSPRVLVQVNTGAEPQKAGVLPDAADALIAAARDTYGLTVEGLMCIPPADQDAEPHFQMLRAMAERNGLSVLSMGMSGDYETAIRCGATHVRVGTALFGERNRPETPSSS